MIRINWVTVKGDNGHSPCRFRAILENGVAVLSMWELNVTWEVDGVSFSEYVRVG